MSVWLQRTRLERKLGYSEVNLSSPGANFIVKMHGNSEVGFLFYNIAVIVKKRKKILEKNIYILLKLSTVYSK